MPLGLLVGNVDTFADDCLVETGVFWKLGKVGVRNRGRGGSRRGSGDRFRSWHGGLAFAHVPLLRRQDAVSSLMLGRIERFVGSAEEAGAVHGIGRVGGHAAADANDAQRLPCRKSKIVFGDEAAHLLRNRQGFRGRRARQEEQEFLASKAPEDALLPDVLLYQAGPLL